VRGKDADWRLASSQSLAVEEGRTMRRLQGYKRVKTTFPSSPFLTSGQRTLRMLPVGEFQVTVQSTLRPKLSVMAYRPPAVVARLASSWLSSVMMWNLKKI